MPPFWLSAGLGIGVRVLLSVSAGALLKHGYDVDSWRDKAIAIVPAIASCVWSAWATVRHREEAKRECAEEARIRAEVEDEPC